MSDDAITYDSAAELGVLAACLDSHLTRQRVRKVIVGGDLYDPRHEAIWTAMALLDRAGKQVDATTVRSALGSNTHAAALLIDLVTTYVVPDTAISHAEIVRSWAIKRRLHTEARQVAQQSLSPDLNPVGYAASVATRFAAIRDSGLPEQTSVESLGALLADPDDEPDWLIPGLLERRDRLMLTGIEGGGKSHLLRQIAVMAAAGLDPFDATRITPLRTTIIDAENSRSQVRRRLRPMAECVARLGGQDPSERMSIDCMNRMDIVTDKSLAAIHQVLDATTPDLVVIGPLYRLAPRALQTDDEAAPVLAALDTIRDRGIALLIEAHAGHGVGRGGDRELRPRGSSSLLGWPEFGYGLRTQTQEFADLIPWRGDRDERNWPDGLRRERNGPRWLPVDPLWRQMGTA